MTVLVDCMVAIKRAVMPSGRISGGTDEIHRIGAVALGEFTECLGA
jgi:hypothetical protein